MRFESNPAQTPWYRMSLPDVLARMHVDGARGLTATDAASRLQRYGANVLSPHAGGRTWSSLREQAAGWLLVILSAVALASAVLGDSKLAIAAAAVLLLNALCGLLLGYHFGRDRAIPRRVLAIAARVRRDGQAMTIPASQLVPGDIVLLEAGNPIPSDGRLLEAVGLCVQEVALTGDLAPLEKTHGALPENDLSLAEQRNMVFMGTRIAAGRGRMVVVETGMRTQIGRVLGMGHATGGAPGLSSRRLQQLGRGLALTALGLGAALLIVGLARGLDTRFWATTALAMAAALVPAGLPAVMLIAQALGARRMAQRGIVVRSLATVDAFGAVSVICAEKTGAFIESQLRVTLLDLTGQHIDLTASYQQRKLTLAPDDPAVTPECDQPALALLLAASALCNDAALRATLSHPGQYHAVGDPAECAWVMAAARCGLWKPALEQRLPRVAALPFEQQRRRMTTVHRVASPSDLPGDEGFAAALDRETRMASLMAHLPTPFVAFTKGSVDSIIEIADHVWHADHAELLDDAWRARIIAAHAELESVGLRVLGVGLRAVEDDSDERRAYAPFERYATRPPGPPQPLLEHLESGLTFIGFIGLGESPLADIRVAIAACRGVGIRPVMLTEDHPLVAQQIATDLGIAAPARTLTGDEIEHMPADGLATVAEGVSALVRGSPDHKLRIVTALQARGEVVALAGDRITDVPALKRADIGLATGRAATDAVKAAAVAVVSDESFATIVSAVMEGRGISAALHKFMRLALAGSVGKTLVVALAPLLGLPLPLHAIQLLFASLFIDGLLGLGMSLAPTAPAAVRRPPERPDERLWGRDLIRYGVSVGALSASSGLGVGLIAGARGIHEIHWNTLILTTLVFAQVFQSLALSGRRAPLSRAGLRANLPPLIAGLAAMALQIALIYQPALGSLLQMAPLTAAELALAFGGGSVVLWGTAIARWAGRGRMSRATSP